MRILEEHLPPILALLRVMLRVFLESFKLNYY
jgi:hypothetical protein